MLQVNDIRQLIKSEIHNNRIKDCGYDCMNGRRYVEIRNAIFECDEDCIFKHIPKLPYMEDDWYEKNYDPILLKTNQLDDCIRKLTLNPMSRQAVLIISSVDNLQCTMYMHVSLLTLCNNMYELEYIVHMRSNDAIEFRTDFAWHKKIYDMLYDELCKYYNIKRKNIIWNADSLQLYEQYFNDVFC